MPVNTNDNAFSSYVIDLMQIIGPVYSKKMFGGYGVFLEGLMFALIADETLYFKADSETEPYFINLELNKFSYNKQDKIVHLSYYQAPDDTLENQDTMKTWSARAYNTALKASVQKKKSDKTPAH